MPGLQNAVCVLAIESNFGNDADWVHSALQTYDERYPNALPRMHFLREDTGAGRRAGTIGILTTDQTKANMARMLELAVDNRRLAFHPDFTTAISTPKSRHEMRKTLVTQLCNFERIVEQRVGNTFAQPRIIHTGKRHGADDLAICMQLNVLAHDRYRREEQRLARR